MRFGISLPVRELGDDIVAIKEFAQAAEELGFTHLRVPDQVIRADSGALHEPHTVMTFVAAVTSKIELVPSVIILPARPTVLVAKQAATLDSLSGGRLRLGIGVGRYPEEYQALGADFHNRGARCEEQMELLRLLWTQETVDFDGKWEKVPGAGINPLPVQRPIPVWIGAFVEPAIKRAGRVADGWFANPRVPPGPESEEHFEFFRGAAREAGRDPDTLGIDATVLAGDRGSQAWAAEAEQWQAMGATHLTFRTMAAGMTSNDQHIEAIRKFREVWPPK